MTPLLARQSQQQQQQQQQQFIPVFPYLYMALPKSVIQMYNWLQVLVRFT